jgi:hypothetical protein
MLVRARRLALWFIVSLIWPEVSLFVVLVGEFLSDPIFRSDGVQP